MKWVVPEFYPRFQCIGGSCVDNCCIGWEIDIDESSAGFYRSQKDFLASRIAWEETPHFILSEQERCPFLNAANLCDIITNYGAEHLCEICREHPRFHEWFGTFRESGIGLCCPETAKFLFQDDRPLRFIALEEDSPAKAVSDEAALSYMLEARERLYAIFTDRSVPFDLRLADFYRAAASMQDEFDGFQPDASPLPLPDANELLSYAHSIEPINSTWTHLLKVCEDAKALFSPLPDWMLEKTAVYLCFRWLGKAAFDGDLFGKAQFIVYFMGLLDFFTRRARDMDAMTLLRLLSKEMEYLA